MPRRMRVCPIDIMRPDFKPPLAPCKRFAAKRGPGARAPEAVTTTTVARNAGKLVESSTDLPTPHCTILKTVLLTRVLLTCRPTDESADTLDELPTTTGLAQAPDFWKKCLAYASTVGWMRVEPQQRNAHPREDQNGSMNLPTFSRGESQCPSETSC